MTVLEAIRLLLKSDGKATRASIKQVAPELSHRHIAETIAANVHYLSRAKNGAITKVVLHKPLRDQLWKSERFYRSESYGAWSHEGCQLTFLGHEDLREQLQEARVQGGIGDSWTAHFVIDTPENRVALEAAGLEPWENAVIDDRLWKEEC